MKNQALIISKDESKKLTCRLLQFFFDTLRFKFCRCKFCSMDFDALRNLNNVQRQM